MKKLVVEIDGTENLVDFTKEELAHAKKVKEQDQIVYEQELAEAQAKAVARQKILDRLGLTADEAKLLLG